MRERLVVGAVRQFLIAAMLVLAGCRVEEEERFFDGGLSTSGCQWEQGLYTKAEIEAGHRFIAQCVCRETSVMMMDGDRMYLDNHEWSDKDGCKESERWFIRKGSEWVSVTKAQYEAAQFEIGIERFTIPVPNVPTKAMTKEEAEQANRGLAK